MIWVWIAALCIISAAVIAIANAVGVLTAAATLTRKADKARATHGLLRLH